MKSRTICMGLILVGGLHFCVAADWTRFRGPNGVGVVSADEIHLAPTFGADDFAWRTKLPGRGHGSPAIIDKKAFLISATKAGAWALSCLETDSGKILWSSEADVKPYRLQRYNSFASCTPVVDDSHVYAILPSVTDYALMAFSHDGKLAEVVYKIRKSAPYMPTPVALGDLLFLVSDGGIASCIDAPTGKTLWRERLPGDFFGSPVLRVARCTCALKTT